ncbi:sigma 54-interacting transcriptional regulator [Desulfuromonas thiophila]|uniref:sigma 54-interacting transcriptional regulator n=1 Tax=Desulfuromonas thiophila TaxID=57664 RepID=UPI0024A83F2C|nr:sigma 54-interacting transcriptional regulator [Desulfuromonas thiophila]
MAKAGAETRLFIICDTAEPSVTKAAEVLRERTQGMDQPWQLYVSRAGDLAAVFENILEAAETTAGSSAKGAGKVSVASREIYIFMLYGNSEQLETVKSLLASIDRSNLSCAWYGSGHERQDEILQNSKRADLPKWCTDNNFVFYVNTYEGIDRHCTSGRPSVAGPGELDFRVWIQYRLMRAIVARSDLKHEINQILQISCKPKQNSAPVDLTNEFERARLFFAQGEPDMAGGRYSTDGSSAAIDPISALRDRLVAYSQTDENVLICGETGTGKESIAWYLYDFSIRGQAMRPYLALNCACLSPEIAASELFGHERGAFTGAHAAAAGLLTQADKGVLFLDELHTLDRSVQQKLLRFVEKGTFYRVGGTTEIRSDVRIIAAIQPGKRNLVADDLFYRLSTFTIDTVPLRMMAPDDRINIARSMSRRLLNKPKAQRSIVNCADRLAVNPLSPARVTPADMRNFWEALSDKKGTFHAYIQRHDWQGNMRELYACVKRYLLAGVEPCIQEKAPAGQASNDVWEQIPKIEFEKIKALYALYHLHRNKDINTVVKFSGVCSKTLKSWEKRAYDLIGPETVSEQPENIASKYSLPLDLVHKLTTAHDAFSNTQA